MKQYTSSVKEDVSRESVALPFNSKYVIPCLVTVAKQSSPSFERQYSSNKVYSAEFVSDLYAEVLEREPDSIGMNYWLGQLNSGAETRYEVLLGFSQSAENTALFTDMTGLG